MNIRVVGSPVQVAAFLAARIDCIAEHFEFAYGVAYEGLSVFEHEVDETGLLRVDIDITVAVAGVAR